MISDRVIRVYHTRQTPEGDRILWRDYPTSDEDLAQDYLASLRRDKRNHSCYAVTVDLVAVRQWQATRATQ